MHLALYRGPATDWAHKIAHWTICILTLSRYSHCELVIDGVCWSASPRDGGVRGKVIDLTTGRWDVFPLQGDAAEALAFMRRCAGAPYDWRGVLRTSPLLRWLPASPKAWFCSEICGAALGLREAETLSPRRLLASLRATQAV